MALILLRVLFNLDSLDPVLNYPGEGDEAVGVGEGFLLWRRGGRQVVELVQLLYLLADEGDHSLALRQVEKALGDAVVIVGSCTPDSIVVIENDVTYASAEYLVLLDTVGLQGV